jgi:hypothetical protein
VPLPADPPDLAPRREGSDGHGQVGGRLLLAHETGRQGGANDAPFPAHQHVGDKADLAATFPPSQYDRCLVWVNHTVRAWELWWPTGGAWRPVSPAVRNSVEPAAADFLLWIDTSGGGPVLKVSNGAAWV